VYIAPNRFVQRARRARTPYCASLSRVTEKEKEDTKREKIVPLADRSVGAEFSGGTVPGYEHAKRNVRRVF